MWLSQLYVTGFLNNARIEDVIKEALPTPHPKPETLNPEP